jgi:hypothetical protein
VKRPGGSCYDSNALHVLKEHWNRKSEKGGRRLILTNSPGEIHGELRTKLKNRCKQKEMCWLGILPKEDRSKAKKRYFAPDAPREWDENPYEWLSSDDISDIMKQHEAANPDFRFIGPSPIDFDKKTSYGDCVWEELCKLNMADMMSKGKSKIGVAFNLDPHHKPGSHWTSLFIHTPRKEISYFDSAGDRCPRRIKKLVKRIQNQGRVGGDEYTFTENHPVEHQMKDTECGIYAIHFMVHMLKDGSFNKFTNPQRTISDAKAHDLRRRYYNFD